METEEWPSTTVTSSAGEKKGVLQLLLGRLAAPGPEHGWEIIQRHVPCHPAISLRQHTAAVAGLAPGAGPELSDRTYRHDAFYCPSQIVHFLQIECLWQPCVDQVYGAIFQPAQMMVNIF